MEAGLFIESAGILLGFDVDAGGAEVFAGGPDGGVHDLQAVSLAPFGGDNPADGDGLHVGAGGTDPAEGDHPFTFGEPHMQRRLVVAVEVLIDAVLLYDEDFTADPEQFI